MPKQETESPQESNSLMNPTPGSEPDTDPESTSSESQASSGSNSVPKGASASGEPEEVPFGDLLAILNDHGMRLAAQADRWRAVSKPLAKWVKPGALQDFAKLQREFAMWREEHGDALQSEFELQPVVDAVEEHLTVGKSKMRKDLGRQLKEACQAAGLKLKVVSREDPVELRIPPFAVRLDLDAGKAQLLFAKQVVETCPATALDVIRCHQATTKRMNGKFESAEFFERCIVAYRMGLAVKGAKWGERLELSDFLVHLASRMQSATFSVDPVASHYRGYSRGQFAFDVHRLRQARGLQQNGKRLNFGVATGTAATQKKRVIYMEDDLGQGEYKLNVYFTEVS